VALSKGDDNGSRSRCGSFAESLSLPRASLSAKLAFAESLAVGKGSMPRVLILSAKAVFTEGLALGKVRPAAKLPFSVVLAIHYFFLCFVTFAKAELT